MTCILPMERLVHPLRTLQRLPKTYPPSTASMWTASTARPQAGCVFHLCPGSSSDPASSLDGAGSWALDLTAGTPCMWLTRTMEAVVSQLCPGEAVPACALLLGAVG